MSHTSTDQPACCDCGRPLLPEESGPDCHDCQSYWNAVYSEPYEPEFEDTNVEDSYAR